MQIDNGIYHALADDQPEQEDENINIERQLSNDSACKFNN
jgi:hypothetical protein